MPNKLNWLLMLQFFKSETRKACNLENTVYWVKYLINQKFNNFKFNYVF